MHFAIICTDKPGSQELRLANRAAHLEYIDRHADQVVLAGPMLSDDGQGMVGSLLIMEFADRAAAEAFCAADPYAVAGLFAKVEIRPWRRVRPQG
ncbi:MAG TPA: YciI family protein [Alphaproteobacteria bacterium]|nr:YciI family protein [Alphaproteobacteria bacterium]